METTCVLHLDGIAVLMLKLAAGQFEMIRLHRVELDQTILSAISYKPCPFQGESLEMGSGNGQETGGGSPAQSVRCR